MQEMEQRLRLASELARKEIKILQNPESRLYDVVREKVQRRLGNIPAQDMQDDLMDISYNLPYERVQKGTTKETSSAGNMPLRSNKKEVPSKEPARIPNEKKLKQELIARFKKPSLSEVDDASGPTISKEDGKFKGKDQNRNQKKIQPEFIVPVLSGTQGHSRTGLKSKAKEYKTDLEIMRAESDQRLMQAVRKIEIKQEKSSKKSKISPKLKRRPNDETKSLGDSSSPLLHKISPSISSANTKRNPTGVIKSSKVQSSKTTASPKEHNLQMQKKEETLLDSPRPRLQFSPKVSVRYTKSQSGTLPNDISQDEHVNTDIHESAPLDGDVEINNHIEIALIDKLMVQFNKKIDPLLKNLESWTRQHISPMSSFTHDQVCQNIRKANLDKIKNELIIDSEAKSRTTDKVKIVQVRENIEIQSTAKRNDPPPILELPNSVVERINFDREKRLRWAESMDDTAELRNSAKLFATYFFVNVESVLLSSTRE
jgi:hypothetical protein